MSLLQQIGEEDTEFIRFLGQYGKSYGIKEEYQRRSEIFKRNLAMIRQENLNKENKFTVGINKFTDSTPEELSKLRSPVVLKTNNREAITNQTFEFVNIPESVDWRQNGAVTPVVDMGNCGGSYAFSAIAAIESGWFIKNGVLYELSQQQFIDCQDYEPYNNKGC